MTLYTKTVLGPQMREGQQPGPAWTDWMSSTEADIARVEYRLRHHGTTGNWADPRVQQRSENANNVLVDDPLNDAADGAGGAESDASSLMAKKGAKAAPKPGSKAASKPKPKPRPKPDSTPPWRLGDDDDTEPLPRSSPGTSSAERARPPRGRDRPDGGPVDDGPARTFTWSSASLAGIVRPRRGGAHASGSEVKRARSAPAAAYGGGTATVTEEPVMEDYNAALTHWCRLLGMPPPTPGDAAPVDSPDFLGVLNGERGRRIAAHLRSLSPRARMMALGHFMAFVSAIMQEVWVLATHPLELADPPPTVGPLPSSHPAPPARRGRRGLPDDGSGSDVQVEVDEATLALMDRAVGYRGDSSSGARRRCTDVADGGVCVDDEFEEESEEMVVEEDEGEETESSAHDPAGAEAEADETCHMQGFRQPPAVPAVGPTGFALLLDTLARALERLEDRRRPVVAHLLLSRLRGRSGGCDSLTGEMLEALLVTFRPEASVLAAEEEPDHRWVDYWWELVSGHLPGGLEASATLVESTMVGEDVAEASVSLASGGMTVPVAEAESGSLCRCEGDLAPSPASPGGCVDAPRPVCAAAALLAAADNGNESAEPAAKKPCTVEALPAPQEVETVRVTVCVEGVPAGKACQVSVALQPGVGSDGVP